MAGRCRQRSASGSRISQSLMAATPRNQVGIGGMHQAASSVSMLTSVSASPRSIASL